MEEAFITKLRRNGVLADGGTVIKKGMHLTCETPVSLTGTQLLYPMSIGRYTYIKGGYIASLVSIGRFCSIGQNLRVGEGMHPTDWLSTHPFQYGAAEWFKFWPEHKEFSPELALSSKPAPVIGNDVWTGANVTIMRGVVIGDGAVIGAGAVVTKSIEPYSIVGGVPAKIIRKRFDEDTIARLLRVRWWDYSMAALQGVPVNNIGRALDALEEKIASGISEKWRPHRVKITADSIEEITPRH